MDTVNQHLNTLCSSWKWYLEKRADPHLDHCNFANYFIQVRTHTPLVIRLREITHLAALVARSVLLVSVLFLVVVVVMVVVASIRFLPFLASLKGKINGEVAPAA